MKKRNELEIPSWLINKDFSRIEGMNSLAEKSSLNIISICQDEKVYIKKALESQDIFTLERDSPLLFILQQENILVQCIERKKNDKESIELKTQREENKKIGEKLYGHSAKLNAIFDSTALFIWTLDSTHTITSLNKRLKERMEDWFFREVAPGELLFEEPREENMVAWNTFQKNFSGCLKGKKQQFELAMLTNLNKEVWIEIFMDPIIHEQTKMINEVSCMAMETTEKKKVARYLKQSLKEKETLLQEVHHRVKNNLQIISSIMSLQSSYVKEEGTKEILTECQNRIKSMSFIHDSLYLNKDLDSIDFNFYIKGLCRNLIQSYSIDPSKIVLDCQVDDVALSLDQAIPCGLIVNELVSNSLKYAFPEERKGTLQIHMKHKEGRLALMVSDDGVGFDENIRLEEIDSLGLQLVFTLIEQLDGEVDYSGLEGTKYLITFDRLKSRKSWQETAYLL